MSDMQRPQNAWQCAAHSIRLISAARQGSQARRRVEIQGPKAQTFGNFGRVFDQLIEFFGPKQGAFRPSLPPNCTLPDPSGCFGGSWSKLAKAFPPAGRNHQGELASPAARDLHNDTSACYWQQHRPLARLSRKRPLQATKLTN
jgi:hypothetical protein